MSLITVTNDNIQTIKEQDHAIVEFSAPWCGYCKRLSPVIKQLSKEMDIHVIDYDEYPDVLKEYGVDTIPTLMVLKHGKGGRPLINPSSKSAIQTWLNEELA